MPPNFPSTLPMLGRRACVLALLGLTGLASAAWLIAQRGRLAAKAARAAFAAGRYSDADQALAAWLREAPQSAEANYLRARTGIELGAPKEQVEHAYLRAHELGCPEADLALVRALGQAKLKQYAEAEPVLREAFRAASKPDPQLDHELARLYIETFDMRRAVPVLDRWAREAPTDPRPYLWHVEVDRRQDGGAAQSIIAHYRQALARDPNLAQARLGLADELRGQHRAAEARAEYEAYLRLRPDDPAAHVGAGKVARELGDDAAAAHHFDAALTLDPKQAEAHRERAELDRQSGDNTAALTHLDRAEALDPFDVDTRYARGLILASLGRRDEAEREQEVAKRLRNELQELQTLKARLLDKPNDPDREIQVARWLFEHGHDDEGARWAEKIVRAQPNHRAANRLLAEYHERCGNAGKANYYRLNAGSEP